ncbi:MAG: TonB-dependent receptor, partial [Acidobacteria bacterium]|nr:TonB-dependent receptor [Acidobacteriota bacterium]
MLWRLFLVTILGAGLYAQTERGNITGAVSDPSGAAVPGAAVAIVHVATNTAMNVQTTRAGEYNAPNLMPGVYRVEITADGFKRFIQDRVTVTAAATVRLDVRLQVGQVSETVEVSSSVVQIQTENAKVTTAVQNKLVDELPLVVGGEMRSPFGLVTITPEARGGGSNLSLGGGQARAWDATLDGLSTTTNRSADAVEIAYIAPSLEAITEFAVDTNGFKAEYGQAGGGVMTFSSKSGTNMLHGSAYEFLRNEKFDAAGYFANATARTPGSGRAVYKQHDFGATVGGPVVLPKIYDGRNRTFFFVGYEGFRNRVGANDLILSVPAPEMYQGDFSRLVNANNQPLTIYDPASTRPNPSGSGFIRDPFPTNQIPRGKFSPAANRIIQSARDLGGELRPNAPTAVPGTIGYLRQNYVSTGGSIVTPTDKGSLKIDHALSDNHRLSFFRNQTSFRREIGPGGPRGLPLPYYSGAQVQAFDTTAYRMNYDWAISPRMLNHFSIGGNTFFKNSFSPNSGKDWKDKVCIRNVVDCNVNFPHIQFTEFTKWGDTTYNGTEQPMWAMKDDLSYIRGSHTFKFGYAFQSQRANGFGQQDISGRADFSFLGTSVPGATSNTSGSSFASFLLGEANLGRTETVRFVAQLYRYHGFYVQDDWRVNRRLTFNFGVRYEFTKPP